MAKSKELTPKQKEVLEFVRENPKCTYADIKAKIEGVNPSHLTALRNKEYVSGVKVKKEVQVIQKKEVLEYTPMDKPTETE